MKQSASAPWSVIPNSPQERFLRSSAFETLLAGKGAGGTEALLAGALRGVSSASWRASIWTRTKEEAAILRSRAQQLYAAAGLVPNARGYSFQFQTGAKIAVAALMYRTNHFDAQTRYVGLDGVQDWSEEEYLYFVRRLEGLVGTPPPRVRATAHPDGPGRSWLRRRFGPWLEAGQQGTVDGRACVRGSTYDNPYLRGTAYELGLRQEPDPVRRARLLENDWRVEPSAEALRDSPHERLFRYRDDPVAFMREVLQVKDLDGLLVPMAPWSRQREIATALTRVKRVAVRSGHKIGKSVLSGALALWWACTRRRAKVIITSSSYPQIKKIVWPELTRLAAGARVQLPDVPLDPNTGMRWPDGREIFGRATDKTENMGGFSSDELLYIVDEASGVQDFIFEACEGNLASGGSMLLLGNPTQTSGYFFDTFNNSKKREGWELFHVSSEETPNITGLEPPIPGLATKEYIENAKRRWGEGSPAYNYRVKGNFPSQAANAVVGLAHVEGGKSRYEEALQAGTLEDEDGGLEFGIDVARYGGDESTIYPRRGLRMLRPRFFRGLSLTQLRDEARALALELRRPGESVWAKVDGNGLGAGLVDMLREVRVPVMVQGRQVGEAELFDVLDVVAGAKPTVDGFFRLRDQVWWAAREWLAAGGMFEADEELERQLLAPTYSVNARGAVEVEPKDDTKEKIGCSPDRADGFCLAVYSPWDSRGVVAPGAHVVEHEMRQFGH